jgi:hypothetical protein
MKLIFIYFRHLPVINKEIQQHISRTALSMKSFSLYFANIKNTKTSVDQWNLVCMFALCTVQVIRKSLVGIGIRQRAGDLGVGVRG